jgi:thioredoxin reductase (NADPH)
MAGTVEDVRDENYKEFTGAPAAIVAYGLATCEPCKIYDPILEETAAKFPDVKIGKAKMHVPGRCREIKKSHTFETYPTTHFFSKGKLLLTREGVVEPAELAALIVDHLLK